MSDALWHWNQAVLAWRRMHVADAAEERARTSGEIEIAEVYGAIGSIYKREMDKHISLWNQLTGLSSMVGVVALGWKEWHHA